MTTFKATVKKPRSDGFYTVYIRITHQRKSSYIKTNKIIDAAHITKGGDLTDPVVNEYCAMLIRQYTDRLNRVNVEKPRDFDPFGQTGFAHLWLQYD